MVNPTINLQTMRNPKINLQTMVNRMKSNNKSPDHDKFNNNFELDPTIKFQTMKRGIVPERCFENLEVLAHNLQDWASSNLVYE